MIPSKPAAVHVALRVTSRVWSLRSRRCFSLIEGSFAEARERFGLRVIEFSVMDKHLHLFVEADDAPALSRSIQELRVRITRGLNRLMGRRGAVFTDRYHARVLASPSEFVTAMAYVLGSAAQQYGTDGAEAFSSSAYDTQKRERLLSSARTWLLIAGWRRPGRLPTTLQPGAATITPDEPGSRSRAA
jgi:putative transposase